VGAVLEEPAGHLSNASIVWGPSTAAAPTSPVPPGPGQRYVKRHPAPFAEYIPYRGFFRHFSDKVDLVRRDFVAGTEPPVLRVGSIPLADVICFEVVYDDLVRDGVRDGGQLIVVQTNNATFGYTDESEQQLAASRIRAIETGRAVVHISTVGVSAMIAPDGTVLSGSDLFTARVLHAVLPLRTEQTLATRWGAGPELAISALGVLLALAGLGRRGRPADRTGNRTPDRSGGVAS
jgi:apolipoprotein N-acyltransferase